MTREIPDSIRAAANQICELLERRTRVSYDEIRDELMSVECLVEDLIAARELAAIREGSELTAEQREWIERYTDFKTDSSPITKAMRAALSALDRYAAENARLKEQLAAEQKECESAKSLLRTVADAPLKLKICQQQLAAKERECGELRALFVACSHTKDGNVPMTLSAAEAECEETLRRIRDLKAGKGVSHEEAMAAIGKARESIGIAPAAEGGEGEPRN